MKKLIQTACTAALLATLAGCSTAPQRNSSQLTPASRVYLKTAQSPETPAQVRLIRDTGVLGSACLWTVYAYGKPAALMASGETVDLFFPAGELVLKVGRDHRGGAMCGNSVDGSTEAVETLVKADQVKVFRVTSNMSRGVFLQRAD